MTDAQIEERREQLREELKERRAEAVKVIVDHLQSDVPIARVMAARAILELSDEIFEVEVDTEGLHTPPSIS